MSALTVRAADGHPVTFIAHYHRYHAAYQEEFDSIEEAVQMLAYGEDYGDLSGNGVSDSLGHVVITDEQWGELYCSHIDSETREWDGWPLNSEGTR